MTVSTPLIIRDCAYYRGFLCLEQQHQLVDLIREICRSAPLVRPVLPNGKPMSVRMTSAGQYGWVSDGAGYRYAERHPSGTEWPPIPPLVLEIWRQMSGSARLPECCLVNFYDETAKMGMHQDRDEADFTAPVVSISLGDDALFRIGNTTRGGKTESLWLKSGDVLVMGGEARLRYHGIDRVKPGSSQLLPKGGRINLTLRVVT